MKNVHNVRDAWEFSKSIFKAIPAKINEAWNTSKPMVFGVAASSTIALAGTGYAVEKFVDHDPMAFVGVAVAAGGAAIARMLGVEFETIREFRGHRESERRAGECLPLLAERVMHRYGGSIESIAVDSPSFKAKLPKTLRDKLDL